MENIFVLDDGTKELTIKNPFGETICNIHIRPSDISIMDRFQRLTDDFSGIVEPLRDFSIKNDGTSDISEEWAKIKAAEKELVDRLNEVFDSSDIGNLFEKRNAFSTVGGEFFVEKVLDMLGNVVNEEMKAENDKVQKRLEKYTKDLN